MYRTLFLVFSACVPMAAAQDTAAPAVAPVTDKVIDGKFLGLSAGILGATVFDTEMTLRSLKTCLCYETNPIFAAVLKEGRPATYAVAVGLDAFGLAMTYKLKKEHRKIWPVPVVAVIGLHLILGIHNNHFAQR